MASIQWIPTINGRGLRFAFGNWSRIHLRAADDSDGWCWNGRSPAGVAMLVWCKCLVENEMFDRQGNVFFFLVAIYGSLPWQGNVFLVVMFVFQQCCRNPEPSVHLLLLITICRDAQSGRCGARGGRIYLICPTTNPQCTNITTITTNSPPSPLLPTALRRFSYQC